MGPVYEQRSHLGGPVIELTAKLGSTGAVVRSGLSRFGERSLPMFGLNG